MKTIPLTNSSKVAIIDSKDYAVLSKFKWREHVCERTSYAIRSWREDGATRSIYMHRQLMEAPAGMDVDHENNDGLDNRRLNLRVMTRTQNLRRSRPKTGSRSGYKGVWWSTKKQRWNGQIQVGSRKYLLGSYPSPVLAAYAYNVAAAALHGSDTFVNVIPEIHSFDKETRRSIFLRVLETLNGKRLKNQYA